MSPLKREIRYLHVVVVQWRQRNVEKRVMQVQNCCFAYLNLLLFRSCRSPSWVWSGWRLYTAAGLLAALCHQSSFLHLGKVQPCTTQFDLQQILDFKYNNNLKNLPPNGDERWIFSSSPCWAFASWWSLFSVATNKQSDWLLLQKQKQAILTGPWVWCARW